MKTENIHVLGDSHTGMYFGDRYRADDGHSVRDYKNLRFSESHNWTIGGATIYGLLKENSRSKCIPNIRERLNEGLEHIVCTFGEVDVRNHIRRFLNGRTIEEGVSEVVSKYEQFLNSIIKLHVSGKILVTGGIPYYQEFGEALDKGATPPLYIFTNELDRQINEMCLKNGFLCVSVLNDITSGQWTTKDYLEDEVHLKCSKLFPILGEKIIKLLAP